MSPTVLELTNHIRCEIEQAPGFDKLSKAGYVAQITLSLKVEDNGGLTPNLSFMTGAGFKGTFNYAIDGNANIDMQQTYNTTYILDLGLMPQDGSDCPTPDKSKPEGTAKNGIIPSLSGSLGVGQIIAGGLAEIDQQKYNLAYKPAGYFNFPSKSPNFGSTVQFMLTLGFDTGPVWTLVNFKGPSGSSKGILNGGHVTTDNLIIAFASAPRGISVEDAQKQLDTATNARDDAEKQNRGKLLTQSSRENLARLQSNVDDARAVLAAAKSGVPQAQESSAAAQNVQSFTTNIILQNLAGSLQSNSGH